MTEDELQAAELLMALRGAAAPTAASPAALPLVDATPSVPVLDSGPPAASAAPEPGSAPAPALPGGAAMPSPGHCLGELGSPAAEVMLKQMMSTLGMAEPVVPQSPQNGGASAPEAAAADGTAAPPLQPAATAVAAASAAPLRLPGATDAAAAGRPGGSMAEAAAADLLSAYQVDSWRIDSQRRGAPGSGR